jgi:DUF1009 family protein
VTKSDPPAKIAAAPLAILCGGGAFPLEVAADAVKAGRRPFLIGIVGWSEPSIEAYPHVWVRIGEVGKLFAVLKSRGVGEMAMVGAMTRPDLGDLRLDWGAVRRASELTQLFLRGDNSMLVGLAAIFEREGVRVIGAHEIAPRLVAPLGPMTASLPTPEDDADIAFGARLLRAMSEFDAGQCVVVAGGRVLAIEAAEGTDGVLARVAGLRTSGRLKSRGPAGVLVKTPKHGQDLRLDMPAVGPETVAGAVRAELRGIALAAGAVLITGREQCVAEADAVGMFVVGFPA